MAALRNILGKSIPFLALVSVPAWALWPMVRLSWDHVVDTRVLYGSVWPTIEPDIWLQIWILAWGAHVLPTAPASLYQANAFFPTANVLARSDHLLGMLPLFAPVYWLTGNPVFAFQFSTLASFLLCGIGLYALLRHVGCGRPVATVVSILWALMGFRVHDGIGRAQLLQYQYLPLVILFFDRYLDRGRRRDLAGAALFLAWQSLTAYWHAYFAVFTALVTISVSGFRLRGAGKGRRVVFAFSTLSVVGALLAVLSFPYLEMAREGQLIPKSMPARFAWYVGSPSFPPGISWVAIAAGAFVVFGRAKNMHRLAPTFVLVALAGVLLSLTTESSTLAGRLLALPREAAVALVPGFRYLRDEYRFLTLASLGIYSLAALGLEAAFRALGARSRLLAAAALATLFAVTAAPLVHLEIPLRRAPATASPPAVYQWLREHGEGGTVLELPISSNLSDAYLDAEYMFFSTYDWLPLINGYTGHPPRQYYEKVRALVSRFPDEAAIRELTAMTGLRWIVLHDSMFRYFGEGGWERSTRFRQIGDFDGAYLVEVLR